MRYRWGSLSTERACGAALVICLLFAAGCAPRVRSISLAPDTLPDHHQVDLWHSGGRVTLHAVRIADDTVSGVMYWQPPACDSCRVTFPLAGVDSLRTSNREAGGLFLASTPFLVLFATLLAWHLSAGSD